MADGKAYTRNTLCFAGLESLVPAMFNFCGTLAGMKVDNAEFGMLTCISLFSGENQLYYSAYNIMSTRAYRGELLLVLVGINLLVLLRKLRGPVELLARSYAGGSSSQPTDLDDLWADRLTGLDWANSIVLTDAGCFVF